VPISLTDKDIAELRSFLSGVAPLMGPLPAETLANIRAALKELEECRAK
jgi:mono/diheme cytochrome c family protein